MRLAYSESHCFAKHNGRSAETGFSNILPAALTMRFAGAPSGDNARRNPFCSLWGLRRPLRREPGPQRPQRAPQPLLQSLETAPATAEGAGPPAATTRAAALLQSLEIAPATAERAGPPAATTRAAAPSAISGDYAGHSGESRTPKRRQRAPQPLLQSHCGESRPPAATTRAAAPSAVSGDCAGHCGESRAPQRRQRAPQPLLQSLETTPATAGVRCDKKGE